MSSSSLTDHIGYWMRTVSNAVSHEFARKLACEDVTVAEWVFVRALADLQPVAPSLLAEKMGMTKGGISKLSERLEAKGLIERTSDPHDRRAHSIQLTPRGLAKVPRLAALADANDAEFFDILSQQERASLLAILTSLAERRNLHSPPIE